MPIKLRYGKSCIKIELRGFNIQMIQPLIKNVHLPADEIIQNSLNFPTGKNNEIISTKSSISIAINDPTRPVPHAQLLNCLMKFFQTKNIDHKRIKLFIAGGSHPPLSKKMIQCFLSESIWGKYSIKSHDCDNLSNLKTLGFTNNNTPVIVNNEFYQSDIKIVLGNIEPHHFMGFSGGIKSAAIGLAGRETITANHSMLTHPKAKMGLFKTNPMRQDIENMQNFIGVDFALNIVQDPYKRILACFWGDPYLVMQKGIQAYKHHIQTNLSDNENLFDVVIASTGGYPKDINLYQAQKALTHACLFAKENAPIILIAECVEGAGNDKFKEFIQSRASFDDVINDFSSQPFELGPHKAFQLALQGKKHPIILYSSLPSNEIIKFHLLPADSPEQALNIAQSINKKIFNIAVLPFATQTIPRIEER